MRKLFILFSFLSLTICAHAQMVSDTSTYQYGFNKKTIVTDVAGKPYQFVVWSKLVKTGSYGLKPVNAESDSTTFILFKRDMKAEEKAFAALPKPPEADYLNQGTSFKFFDLQDINGTKFKAADMVGKIVVVNFWFIACPICRYEMPELNRLVSSYQKDKDVVFISLAYDEKKALQQFLKVSPFKYPVVADMAPLFTYYGVKECPLSLVIDKTGVIKFQCVGYGEGAAPYWIKKTIEEIKLSNL